MPLEGAELGFTSGLSGAEPLPLPPFSAFSFSPGPLLFQVVCPHISNLIRPQAQLLGRALVRPDVRELVPRDPDAAPVHVLCRVGPLLS